MTGYMALVSTRGSGCFVTFLWPLFRSWWAVAQANADQRRYITQLILDDSFGYASSGCSQHWLAAHSTGLLTAPTALCPHANLQPFTLVTAARHRGMWRVVTPARALLHGTRSHWSINNRGNRSGLLDAERPILKVAVPDAPLDILTRHGFGCAFCFSFPFNACGWWITAVVLLEGHYLVDLFWRGCLPAIVGCALYTSSPATSRC